MGRHVRHELGSVMGRSVSNYVMDKAQGWRRQESFKARRNGCHVSLHIGFIDGPRSYSFKPKSENGQLYLVSLDEHSRDGPN